MEGVEWLGRHFAVSISRLYISFNSFLIKVTSTKSHHKLRLYTTVLSYTDDNIEFRKKLIDFFNDKMAKSQNNSIIKLDPPQKTYQNLPLIIKRYDFPNTLSAEIHQANINDKFEIQGPLVK